MPRFLRLAAPLVFVLGSFPLASAQELLESNGRRIATPASTAAAAVANARRADSAPAFGISSTTRVTVGALRRHAAQPHPPVRKPQLRRPHAAARRRSRDRRRRLPDPPADGSAHHLGHRELLRQHRWELSLEWACSRPTRPARRSRSRRCRSGPPMPACSRRRWKWTRLIRSTAPSHSALLAILHVADETHYEGFITANIDYHLQVSPAPATRPSWTCRPTTVFPVHRGARGLGHHGRLRRRQLLPRQPVTRGQMAVFLCEGPRACTFRTDRSSTTKGGSPALVFGLEPWPAGRGEQRLDRLPGRVDARGRRQKTRPASS